LDFVALHESARWPTEKRKKRELKLDVHKGEEEARRNEELREQARRDKEAADEARRFAERRETEDR
jgi:hypothetical protein